MVKEAIYIATTGRPGPVVVDFPKNLQQTKCHPKWPTGVDIPGYVPSQKADDLALNEIIGLIEKSERPVLYCGGGIITSGAASELKQFAEATGIPVTTTIMGCGAFPETHPLSLRWLGMHGAAFANWAVSGEFKQRQSPDEELVKLKQGADLLLAFGVRFDDRVTGKVDEFCKSGTIVHIDIDQSEHNKNRKVQLAIESDIKYALSRLNAMIRQRAIRKKFNAWQWTRSMPGKNARHFGMESPRKCFVPNTCTNTCRAMRAKSFSRKWPSRNALYELSHGEAIITTGVGQHQMWAGQYYKFTRPRQFITSAGLGAMGFLALSGGFGRESRLPGPSRSSILMAMVPFS